jgi:DNA repair exonuclease SbcCD ATPase subunit
MSEPATDILQTSPEREPSPLETLTSLVLDAADAANDSAQSASEAISKLTVAVESNRAATSAIRTAPAIFGAVTLGIGVIMALVVAISVTKINQEVEGLREAIGKQSAQFSKVEESLKELKGFEGTLEKFKTIAEDTTQRAIVTLREQVKTDRLALQQLEVKRLNETVKTIQGATQAPVAKVPDAESARAAALAKGLAHIEARLDELAKVQSKPPQESAAALRKSSDHLEAQSKDLRALQEEVTRVRADIASLRAAVERAPSLPQQGIPAYRKP